MPNPLSPPRRRWSRSAPGSTPASRSVRATQFVRYDAEIPKVVRDPLQREAVLPLSATRTTFVVGLRYCTVESTTQGIDPTDPFT
jgi:hypothetical protein